MIGPSLHFRVPKVPAFGGPAEFVTRVERFLRADLSFSYASLGLRDVTE